MNKIIVNKALLINDINNTLNWISKHISELNPVEIECQIMYLFGGVSMLWKAKILTEYEFEEYSETLKLLSGKMLARRKLK